MMPPYGDHMMLNDDQMPGHMIPDRDHTIPHIGQVMSDEENAATSEDQMMPNNDWVLHDNHMMHVEEDHMTPDKDHTKSSTDHMTPHMGPPMDHMMSYENQVGY